MRKADLSLKEAWLAGQTCLHAADTLPGLSFDPFQEKAWEHLCAIKGREPSKVPVSLISKFDLLSKVWRPLPSRWFEFLEEVWPAPLTIVWTASSLCPPVLIGPGAKVAIRFPKLEGDSRLELRQFLDELDRPFPSSSVNLAGEAPASTWQRLLHLHKCTRKFGSQDLINRFLVILRGKDQLSWKFSMLVLSA